MPNDKVSPIAALVNLPQDIQNAQNIVNPPTVSPLQPTGQGNQVAPIVTPANSAQYTATPAGQLDPTIVNVAKAIRTQETGANGNFTAQGGSGEYGAYQFTAPTWNAVAPLAGVTSEYDKSTPQEQNAVAYAYIKSLKDQGYNVGQIASIWNSGKPDPTGNIGTNASGVAYDTPTYVNNVWNNYQALKGQTQPTQAQTQTPSTDQNPSIGGFLQNVAGSAGNFLANLGTAITHPIKTVEGLGTMGVGGLQELGGEQNSNTAAFDQLKSYFGNRYGSPRAIANTVYTDPVGFAADLSAILGIGGGVAGLAGKGAEVAGLGRAAIDAGGADFVAGAEGVGANATRATASSGLAGGLSDTASALGKGATIANPLTIPIKGVGKVLSLVSGPAATVVGSVSGLGKDAVQALWSGDTTVAQAADISRASVGDELQAAFDSHLGNLSETGAGYTPIKEITTPIAVESDFLENQLRTVGKLDVVDGTIKSTTVSDVGSGQLGKLQSILDDFKPSFQKGELTPEEYLALRGRLADAAYNDSGIKNSDIARIAGGIRENLNATYRTQVSGLEELDSSFSAQKANIAKLREGLFYKTGINKGQLMPSALSKIANATKTGNDARLAQLEEIMPGITQRIQAANIAEQITNAIEKSGGGLINSLLRTAEVPTAVVGFATGNLQLSGGAIATYLLSNPTMVAKVLEILGPNKPLMASVVQHLGKVATLGAVTAGMNNSPQPQTQETSGQSEILPQGENTQTPQTPIPSTNVTSQSSSLPDSITSLPGYQAAIKAGYTPEEISAYLQTQ